MPVVVAIDAAGQDIYKLGRERTGAGC